MKIRAGAWLLVAACSWMCSAVNATPTTYASDVRNAETKYRTPEDVLNTVPVINSIPRSFLFGDGYHVHLNRAELEIDHMTLHTRAPVSGNQCMIGLSYMAPTAFFSTRFDVPLFSAKTPAWSDWTMNSLGDYVLRLSRDSVDAPSIRLVATARF
ncbi:MAG TPA: hypothetical protein VMU17_02645 [Elusimicrobiota bacterium]|nr:hypothetical protein [Elusimicrobiota bacterium]